MGCTPLVRGGETVAQGRLGETGSDHRPPAMLRALPLPCCPCAGPAGAEALLQCVLEAVGG